jgi:uncharacterized protein
MPNPSKGMPMNDRGSSRPGPIQLTDNSRVAYRPATRGFISGGLWADRRQINRDVSVPEAWHRLHEAGNFHNLELAAGIASGEYVNDLPFLDSDLYKWLEAIGWALADPELTEDSAAQMQHFLDASYKLLDQVQEDDGYLDSHFQRTVRPAAMGTRALLRGAPHPGRDRTPPKRR